MANLATHGIYVEPVNIGHTLNNIQSATINSAIMSNHANIVRRPVPAECFYPQSQIL